MRARCSGTAVSNRIAFEIRLFSFFTPLLSFSLTPLPFRQKYLCLCNGRSTGSSASEYFIRTGNRFKQVWFLLFFLSDSSTRSMYAAESNSQISFVYLYLSFHSAHKTKQNTQHIHNGPNTIQ